MQYETNKIMVRQAEEATQDAEQYIDLAARQLQKALDRLSSFGMISDETAELRRAIEHKHAQVKATLKLVNQAHDGIGIAADFSDLQSANPQPCMAASHG